MEKHRPCTPRVMTVQGGADLMLASEQVRRPKEAATDGEESLVGRKVATNFNGCLLFFITREPRVE